MTKPIIYIDLSKQLKISMGILVKIIIISQLLSQIFNIKIIVIYLTKNIKKLLLLKIK